MIWLETSNPSLVRRVWIKLWPTAIDRHWAILWCLCPSTAPGTLAISEFLSAPPQIVLLFKAQLVQAFSAAQGKLDSSVAMCLGWTNSGRSSADLGILLQLGCWAGGAEGAAPHWDPCSLLTCSPVPSLGVQHSAAEKMPVSLTPASCCPWELSALCVHCQHCYKITSGISLL